MAASPDVSFDGPMLPLRQRADLLLPMAVAQPPARTRLEVVWMAKFRQVWRDAVTPWRGWRRVVTAGVLWGGPVGVFLSFPGARVAPYALWFSNGVLGRLDLLLAIPALWTLWSAALALIVALWPSARGGMQPGVDHGT